PLTVARKFGVRPDNQTVLFDAFLAAPDATAPTYGGSIPTDRVLRSSAEGDTPAAFYQVILVGSDGMPVWRHIVNGDTRAAPIPDLSSIDELEDIPGGVVAWVVIGERAP